MKSFWRGRISNGSEQVRQGRGHAWWAWLCCVSGSWLLPGMLLADEALPELAGPGTPGFVSGELIYSLEDRPTPECHASTIVETSSGMIAAWFGGTREKNPDVGIWLSRLENGAWSRPRKIVSGAEREDQEYACWNPVLFQPKEGPLLLFYKVGPDPRTWWGMLTTSADDGKTWSEPRRLGTDPALGEGNTQLIGPVKNKPIQLADGSLLCPSSSEHQGWRVHFERSQDLGKTWEVIGPIHDATDFNAIQPSILTYPDGRMQVLCRSREKALVQSWSEDGGQTWGPVTATSLPNPSSGTDAVTLADGRQWLIYNHTPSRRTPLNIASSQDGNNWTPIITLETQSGEYSYPAIIQTSDGKVHATYTYRRQSIKHVVIDPAQVK